MSIQIKDLHPYQVKALYFAMIHQNCILQVDMGLGKTLTMLKAIDLMFQAYDIKGKVGRVLIVAPKRVAEHTWSDENEKWELGLNMVVVKGDKSQRQKLINQHTNGINTIFVVSRENIKDITHLSFDMLIIDELTSFKNIESQRAKQILKIKADRKIGLTGTFLANGAIDIFGQALCCGLSLIPNNNFRTWRATYFIDALKGSGLPFSQYKIAPFTSLEKILEPIKDNIFTLSADDYLQIPEVVYSEERIHLTDTEYRNLGELDAFLAIQIENGTDVLAIKEKSKFAKLQTLCNGFVYDDNHNAILVSESTKLRAVADYVIEMVEQGENILLFYAFKAEEAILTDLLLNAKIKAVNIANKGNIIEQWNNGKIQVLMAQPQSAGHGLNLQRGGRIIVWSTLTYNYELFAQGCARLARQGQKQHVIIKSFIAQGTTEERIYKALIRKASEQTKFVELTK